MVPVQGLVISCCLVCAVLFGSAAYDYVAQYWVAMAPALVPPVEPVPAPEVPAPEAPEQPLVGNLPRALL